MAETGNKNIDLERFKNATAAAMRAIARNNNINVSFSANESPIMPHKTMGEAARLPLPDYEMSDQSTALVRGDADAKALRLQHHDFGLHSINAPLDLTAKAAFDALEQARCESLGVIGMRGVAKNLSATLSEKCKRLGFSNLRNREEANMADALHVMARLAITGETPPAEADKLIENWAPWIKDHLGAEGFSSLRGVLNDQNEFAKQARDLIAQMDMKVGEHREQTDSHDDSDDDSDDNDTIDQDDDTGEDGTEDDTKADDSQGLEGDDDSQTAEDQGTTDQGAVEETADDINETDPAEGMDGQMQPERPKGFIPGPEDGYLIYTTANDEIVSAEDLAEPQELDRLRGMLDQQLSHMQSVTTRLANRLQRKLMARQQRSWQFDQDDGVLDAARLSRIIANPSVPLVYKHEKETEFRDTVVTLLIDNSGSMRGRPIAIAAMCTDILARTLERCGVKVEVLGFTTRAWKGGKSRDLWMSNGRPEHPGRLNDLRHIVYKRADSPWRRSKRNLGLMLKEGILKENIDGEALGWAYNRIAARGEQRKIMMVISDGAPVDDSTLSVNPSNILERDLRNVIDWIETKSPVELNAIGIGHDVTRYYDRALTIADADELGEALIGSISDLFDEQKPPQR
jgi:cobaltochelatase CobT